MQEADAYITDPSARIEKLIRAFKNAVVSDQSPIVLKISFPVGGRQPKGIKKKPGEHHLALHSTEDYVVLRRMMGMNEWQDQKYALAQRLEVSYGQDRIKHSEFAMDRPEKIAAQYETHPRRRLDGSHLDVHDMPRCFYLRPTYAERHTPSRKEHKNKVTGSVDRDIPGRGTKILLEAHLDRKKEESDEWLSTLRSPKGAFVIARGFTKPGSTSEWAIMEFEIHNSRQLSPAAHRDEILPLPVSAQAPPVPVKEEIMPPRIAVAMAFGASMPVSPAIKKRGAVQKKDPRQMPLDFPSEDSPAPFF